jgi:hypothetical protein
MSHLILHVEEYSRPLYYQNHENYESFFWGAVAAGCACCLRMSAFDTVTSFYVRCYGHFLLAKMEKSGIISATLGVISFEF